MSAPFPSDLTAAPQGGAVAWVLDQHGARNIWVAEAPAYQGRQLTHYRADDGQEIAEITWTPDGRSIIFVRGGDFETHRDNPNPASLPQGVDQNIWIAALTGGAPRKIAEGNEPAVSPKGDRIAFLQKDEIWSVGLDENAKPTQLIHAKGQAAELRWSPDGSRLAFVSTRTDHSFIGVYNVGAQSLLYLDPSVDRDSDPVWSPDGKQIAFIRIAASTRAFSSGRNAPPSNLGPFVSPTPIPETAASFGMPPTAPAASFMPWSPTINCSGARAIASFSLGNARAGCISIPSPRTATRPRRSTPTVNSKSNTSHSPATAAPSCSPPIRTTSIAAISGASPSSAKIWRRSRPATASNGPRSKPATARQSPCCAPTPRNPARASIKIGNGEVRDLAPDSIPADFPAASLVVPQQVILSAADGMRIHGQLFLPADAAAGREASRHRSSSTVAHAARCCSAGITWTTTTTPTR